MNVKESMEKQGRKGGIAMTENELIRQLQAENKRLRALCQRESGVLKEALKRKNNKSMIAVVADSLEKQALKGE